MEVLSPNDSNWAKSCTIIHDPYRAKSCTISFITDKRWDTPDVDMINFTYDYFFSYNLIDKATRDEVEDTFNFSQNTSYRWRFYIIDNPPTINQQILFSKSFYRSQGCRKTSKIRRLRPFQIFVMWMISLLMAPPGARYNKAAYRLELLLQVFTPEDFSKRLEKWKTIMTP